MLEGLRDAFLLCALDTVGNGETLDELVAITDALPPPPEEAVTLELIEKVAKEAVGSPVLVKSIVPVCATLPLTVAEELRVVVLDDEKEVHAVRDEEKAADAEECTEADPSSLTDVNCVVLAQLDGILDTVAPPQNDADPVTVLELLFEGCEDRVAKAMLMLTLGDGEGLNPADTEAIENVDVGDFEKHAVKDGELPAEPVEVAGAELLSDTDPLPVGKRDRE